MALSKGLGGFVWRGLGGCVGGVGGGRGWLLRVGWVGVGSGFIPSVLGGRDTIFSITLLKLNASPSTVRNIGHFYYKMQRKKPAKKLKTM
jgi:hypothetical protein